MKKFSTVKLIIAVWTCMVILLTGQTRVLAAGSLSIAVSSSSVSAGETMTVTVYAVNEEGEEATSDMTITYDSSKLEYVSASGTGASGGGGTVKVTGSAVDVKFKAVSSGDAYVKAEGTGVTAAGAHINVSGSAPSTGTLSEETDTSNKTLSGDNSLSSLKLSAGTLSPAFKGSVTNYTASVGSDVSDITVTPVTSNSKAKVESITGNTGLKTGENVIAITVKAENGTAATYRITVTKSDTVATSSNNPQTDEGEPSEGEGTPQENPSDTSGGGDSITIDGQAYHIVDEFPESEIPEGFSSANFEYKGVKHKGLSYESGHMGLYYLSNDAGEGKFFVYDADRDDFYPYVRLQTGEHFIILMVVPNGAVPPTDYRETTVVIQDVTVPAYQYFGKDVEIVNLGDTEMPEGSTGSDFYLLYGMDPEGVAGWYQFDRTQGTYQRLNTETASDEDEAANYETLLKSYNELNTRYKDTKTKDRRVIAVLIFVTVVLLIVILNIILHNRDRYEDDEEEYIPKRAKPSREKSLREKPVREKPSREKPVREKSVREKPDRSYVRMEEDEDSSSFYAGDTQEIMTEFEDEPSILSKHTVQKRKERQVREVIEPVKPARKPEPKREPKRVEHPSAKKEDDDIEFLDLNDL